MKKKPGRPPSVVANVPRFMINRSRVTVSVMMPAPTAGLLKEYVRWGAKTLQITEEEAQAYTMEQALGDLIRSDRMFAEAQREAANKDSDPDQEGEKPSPDSAAATPLSSVPRPPAANGGGPQVRPPSGLP